MVITFEGTAKKVVRCRIKGSKATYKVKTASMDDKTATMIDKTATMIDKTKAMILVFQGI